MAMLIDCAGCGDLIRDDDEVVQDPEDGTPYHRTCWWLATGEEVP